MLLPGNLYVCTEGHKNTTISGIYQMQVVNFFSIMLLYTINCIKFVSICMFLTFAVCGGYAGYKQMRTAVVWQMQVFL